MDRAKRFILLLLLLSFFTYSYGESLFQRDSVLYSDVLRQNPVEFKKYCTYYLKAEQATDADSIIIYSESAIEIANTIGINPARALILKGNGLHLSGRLTQAVKCFTKAAILYKEADNLIGVATAYTYLSEAYISQQNHNNVKIYLNKAIDIFKRKNDSLRLASAFHNMGFEYYRVHQYDSALILFSRAGEIYRKLHSETENAYCIGNAGLVYSSMDNLVQAQRNLLRAIKILEQDSDTYAVADFTREYAHVLQRKGDNTRALRYAYKSYGIASENNITELKRDAAFQLSKIYEQMQRYDSAFHYQLIYYTLSDSIRNFESIQKIADLRTEFEVAQKQTEVDILKKNKTIQGFTIGGLGIIIVLGAVFIVLIYISLKRNRKLTLILEKRRKQQEKQSTELRELNRIKDRFFSIISHDLRSPLASLGGVSYLIKESLETKNRALLDQATDYIDQTVISLTNLLENLLNWALSQQGKFPFKEEPVELESLINEVVKTFASVTLTKKQHIELHLEHGLIIPADKNSLMTIFRNLLSNALKFSNSGTTITITAAIIKNSIAEIRIADKGVGIPKEKMKDLFILKENKSSRGTDNEKGIGLGLTLVQEFVKQNDGTIQVESHPGKGTTFTLQFSLQK